jgi:pyruvate dehydrogenase E2 component (dihydrolipoamide acetyltransferase)
MTVREFKLPDPGEGLTEAEIVTWKVKPGDTVKVNDIIVEIETAKSLVELPVPFAGTVSKLLVEEGTTVEVGTPIIAVDTAGGGAPAGGSAAPVVAEAPEQGAVEPGIEGSPAPKLKPEEEVEEGKIGGTTSTGRTAVLVGYGVRQTEAKRRPRRPSGAGPLVGSPDKEAPHPPSVPGSSAPLSGEAVTRLEPQTPAPPEAPAPRAGGGPALAKPPVRKFAKDLGVDLHQVAGSGEGGIITRADVEAHAARTEAAGPSAPSEPAQAPHAYAVAHGPGMPVNGRGETRTPIKGVRKMTAQAMVGSAFTAPHVTEWVTVDVSRTMDLVERLKKEREFADVKVTPLLVLAKAMCIGVRRHPEINATWDEQAQEIAVRHYVNLGIAAATPRGLIVPNIKDADLLTLRDLAAAIGALTATARDGRTQPADTSGGTITITNVGVFGVDTGTPILNPGEAAIMAFGAIRRLPWVITAPDGTEAIEPRWVTQLGLSFDHRLVDGELGSRYLADVAAILEDPARALVWG